MWYIHFDSFLIQIGFTRSITDPNVYIYFINKEFFILAIYVDDTILATNSLQLLHHIKSTLNKKFEMSDLGEIHHCLGLKILCNRNEGYICITQERYLQQKLQEFHFQDCNPISTPMETSLKLSILDSPTNDEERLDMAKIPYKEHGQ
jgi:hypothetical protein